MSVEEYDGDSPMVSSVSNEDRHHSDPNEYHDEGIDEDEEGDSGRNLFSSSDRPSTPKNNHLNATAPGELSPPQSQSTSQQHQHQHQPVNPNTTAAAANPTDMGSLDEDYAEDAPATTSIFPSTNPNGMTTSPSGDSNAGQSHVAGMGWKTKKANEDYQRAAEVLVDRDFSLREFGDLFDDRRVVG